MKVFKRVLDFYINSSIHVAFAVLCLLEITVLSNHLNPISDFRMCVFFGTILGYNFLKYFEVFRRGDFRTNTFNAILVLSLLAGIGFIYFFYFLNSNIQKSIALSGFLVLMYPLLRKQGWLKLFVVSFAVTFITTFIPFQTVKGLPFELYLILIQRFLILISLLIPFEILDSKTDDKTLNTLPQLFGINRTKWFGNALILPFIVLEFSKSNPSYWVILIGIITVLFIQFTTLKRPKYYTSFWVESVPILWWTLLYFF
jgi:hypothetical protein